MQLSFVKHQTSSFRLGWALALILFLMPVMGQTDEESEDEGVVILENIVVTARKREEMLQETPIAITAFSSREVESIGMESIHDFINLTPNMTVSDIQNIGTIYLSIRGISQVLDGEAPVAVTVDGVLLATTNAINRELYDIDSIEILKGPQGALYGRNAIGGAISIDTKPISLDFENQLKLGLGNDNERKAVFSSSGPLGSSERFFYRFSGLSRDHDGHIQNDFLERGADSLKDRSLNLKLLYTAENLTLDLRHFFSKIDAGVNYYIPVFEDDMPDQVDSNPFFNEEGLGEREMQETSFKLEYSLPNGVFTAITAFNELDEQFSGDVDYAPVPVATVLQGIDLSAFSQELRWTSSNDQRLRWIVGGYYQDSETARLINSSLDFDVDGTIDQDNLSVFDNLSETSALFVQADFDITDAFELSSSLRYDRDERSQEDQLTFTNRSETFDKLQSKFSLSYTSEAGALTYVSYSDGFRSGGFNPPRNAIFPDVFGEETSESLELGFKKTFMENRARFNLALFSTDFKGQQFLLADFETVTPGVVNFEDTSMTGGEIELAVAPMKGLQLLAAYGFTDSEIDSLDESNPFYANFPLFELGHSAPRVTKNTLNLSVQEQLDFDSFDVRIRIDYSRLGKHNWHLSNDVRKPIDLVNARFSYERVKWSVAVFGRNLLDEKYNDEFIPRESINSPFDLRYPAQPRTYGMDATYRF